jgi:hypothetical protein
MVFFSKENTSIIKEKVEAQFDFVETEIEIRIESLKAKLDDIGIAFKNKLDRSKTRVNR